MTDEPSNSILLDILEQNRLQTAQLTRVEVNLDHVVTEQHNAAESRKSIHNKLDSQGDRLDECEAVLARIAPLVDAQQRRYLDNQAVRNMQRRFLRKSYLAAAAGGAAVTWLVHEWDALRAFVLRIFR